MPITMRGDPPPKPEYRWILPAVLALIITLTVVPLAVVSYHNSAIQTNQNAVIDALRGYAQLQAEYFEREKHFAASFDDLGGEWSKVKDASALNPTIFHGYRFHLFTSRAAENGSSEQKFIDAQGRMTGGYAVMAVPVSYGYTARYTFFISNPGDTLYYHDLGVKTDTVARSLSQYFIPPGARSMKGK